ncbi:Tn7-like transposition protein D [Virgibacillus soli]|nr:Tn7-like transposition protein D [Virgibacillus soli]
MVGYFPIPYKDELYYSIIARYHFHTSSPSKTITTKELFGIKHFTNIEYPVGLDHLIPQINFFSESYTKEYFIDNHTMIPLARPFKEKGWYEKILDHQYTVTQNKKIFSSKHGDVEFKDYLFYCSECLKDQIDYHGEGYWNRLHQVPGVYVCTKHRIPLIKYTNTLNYRKEDFVLPLKKDIESPKEDMNYEFLEYLLNLAEDVEYIVSSNFKSFSKEYLFQKYETLMEIKGIGYPILTRQQKLEELILDYYPFEFLEKVTSSFQSGDKFSWLRFVLSENSIYFCHPIRHTLLMRCLCGSVKDFFEKEYRYEPFGKGPWICMNPLADHYKQKCVEEVDISVHSLNREIQGDFKCSCGFIYRLREWERSPLEILYFNNRIMQKGHVWEQKFNELLEQKLTIVEIAKRTNYTRPTIRKILRDRKDMIKSGCEDRNRKKTKKTENYKRCWAELRIKYPHYDRTELNNIGRAAYAWLNKYDKEWLENNSPLTKTGTDSKRKKYSYKEDLKYLEKAKKIVRNWHKYEESNKKLMRMSYASVSTLISSYARFYYRKELYPMTVNFLNSINESVDDFQKRRVRNVLHTTFRNKEVTISKVAEAASVRQSIREGNVGIGDYVEKLVKIHNEKTL